MSARTRTDWILAGATGCALVSTAYSEWNLAVSMGAHPWVALAVPGALDLYVLRALQVHRDVLLAVLAMVSANVAWYLVHSGDLTVNWQLRSAVGALAPLVLWRVHSLKYTRTRQELLWGLSAGQETGAGSAPVPVASAPALGPEYTAPDHVPASWMDEEYPETYPSAPALVTGCAWKHDECAHSDGECTVFGSWKPGAPVLEEPNASALVSECALEEPSAPALLRALPDLPPEYAPSAVHSTPPLNDSDWDYVPGAQEYVDNCAKAGSTPSVRGLMADLHVGQTRAERLLTHLGVRA